MTYTNTPCTIKFKAEAVTAAYSGKNGKCCCGCAGKHYRRADGDTKQINRVVKIMNDTSIPFDMVEPGSFVSKVVGKRLHIAYFDER